MDVSIDRHLLADGNDDDLGPDPGYTAVTKKPTKKSCMARIFPTGFKHEMVELLKYSWPIVLTQFFNSFVRIVTIMFAGHLGKLELGGATLAISLANLVGNSISIGLIATCDTYFSQSYGSPNKFQVGVYLQTAIYVTTLSCLVACAPMANIRTIMLNLGQNPVISLYAEQFILIFLPALLFISFYQLLSRYLIIQGIVIPSVLIGFLANVVHALLQYLLTIRFPMGIPGTTIALVGCLFVMFAGVVGYVLISKVYRATWSGWTKSALQDWGQFMKLGLFSIMMISIEWWTFEISFFLMGILGSTQIGASSILYQIYSFYSSFSKGIGSACAYRVGRYLGATRVEGAITAARVAIVLAYIMSIASAIFTMVMRDYLPLVFASDPDVVEMARQMIPILAVFSFFVSAKDICGGIVRGTGKQVLGGIVVFVAYGIVAMPVGVCLMFYTSSGASGFWWGLNMGLALASTSLIVIVLKVDWRKESENALQRAKVTRKKKSNDDNKKGSTKVEASYGSIELVFMTSVQRSPGYWRSLITKRIITVIICLALFAFGFVARFVIFIPEPVPTISLYNITTVNGTLLSMVDPVHLTQ